AAALTPCPRARARRALAAAAAHVAAGVPARVPDLLAAAELGPLDRLQQAHAGRLRARASAMTDSGRGAVRPLLDAADRFRDLDPAVARETYLAAFDAAVWAGRYDEGALRRVAEAARGLPPGDEPGEVFLRALVDRTVDGPVAVFPRLARALRSLGAEEDPSVLWAAAHAAAELGDLRAWLDIGDRAVGFARRTGTLSLLSTALPFQASALGFAGRFSQAGELLAEAAALEKDTGAVTRTATAALIGAYRGRERPALEEIEALEREGEQRGLGRLVGVAACARAVLHNGLGNYALALEAARRGAEYQDPVVHLWTCGELVEAATRAGDPDAAARACGPIADWSRAGTPWALGAHAVALALTGAPERAEDRYREAVDRFGRGGLGVFEVRARLLFGEWLRRQNRRAQARTELRAAHAAAVETGLEAFAERARRELLATGETVRKRTPDAPVLTPQEAQIARLAASGHPNAEIGARLFLSPRTVEWHLRKVFTKLGISSRREIEGAFSGR
ncbi:LuxR C-terminal-related transcriptional regulator, partial [Kitasatospora sp. NPDC056783]|uniref:LuxR C-terminal-related transcriptional regulator n=1 Tax=Kitasatospora sp. NPDC056783 TaxID=3345943 RepID=UPI0036CD03C1